MSASSVPAASEASSSSSSAPRAALLLPSLGLITAPRPRNIAGPDARSTLAGKDRVMHERITWPANGNLYAPGPPPVSSCVFPPSLGPIPHLPADALGKAFSFLLFVELCSVVKVSHGWHQAVREMLPLTDDSNQSAWCARVGTAIPGPKSPLTLHVRAVHCPEIKTGELFVLSRRLSNVVRMNLNVALSGSRLCFPAGLTELFLNITYDDPPAEEIAAVLVDVAALPLLSTFKLYLNLPQSELSLAALPRCASLRSFALLNFAREPTQLSDQQVDEIRSLNRLDCLEIAGMDALLMQRLLRRPHELEWKELRGFHKGLQSECADLLAWLPTLTRIDDSEHECGSVDFMEDLPGLRFINLRFDGLMSASAVLEGLQHLVQLTDLRLTCSPLDAAQLSSGLSVMPSLSNLELRFSTMLRSLSFLDAIPKATQLQGLTIYGDQKIALRDLRHLHRFKRLQRLTLSHVFEEPLDSYSRSLFAVPSFLFPSLLASASLHQQGDAVDQQYQRIRNAIPDEPEEVEHRF